MTSGEAVNWLINIIADIGKAKHGDLWHYEQALTEIREMLEADAQPEIIRCKDCKYAEVADTEDSQDGYICQFHRGSIWFSGSYCSWAERRQDELRK